MSNSDPNRLDRLEALAETFLLELQEIKEGLREDKEGLKETRAIPAGSRYASALILTLNQLKP